MTGQELAICLWYDDQADEAATFYTSIFRDAQIGLISRFGKEGFEFHGKPEGTVMTVDFRLNGMKFVALNGGPQFKFNEATSIMVHCETQEEIDHYWTALTEGGEEGPCGWLKDKFGVSWQIVPTILTKYLVSGDAEGTARVNQAVFQMKKFDIRTLREAYEGAREGA